MGSTANKTWNKEEREAWEAKIERTEEILYQARQENHEPELFSVDFKTGEYIKYDASNIKFFKPRKPLVSKNQKSKKKVA